MDRPPAEPVICEDAADDARVKACAPEIDAAAPAASLARRLVLLLRDGWTLVLPREASQAASALAASQFADPADCAALLELGGPAEGVKTAKASELVAGELVMGQSQDGSWFPAKVRHAAT